MLKIAIVLITLLCVACDNSRGLKRFYYKYLDPPPQISLRSKDIPIGEIQLANVVIPLDEKLQSLSRFLSVQDKVSYEEWLRSLSIKFPWVQGAGILSKDGGILYAQPEGLFNPISFTPLIDIKTTGLKLQQKAMFLPVSKSDAFLFLGQPVFNGEELIEFRVVAISFSTLAGFSENSSKLYLIGNNEILWKGTGTDAESPIYSADWKKLEYNTVSGVVKNKGKKAEYVIIYIGSVPMIVAVDIIKKE